MPRLQACLRRRGIKKDHNAASVEGRYRGQYLKTSRTAGRSPRNPSLNRVCAGMANLDLLEPSRGQNLNQTTSQRKRMSYDNRSYMNETVYGVGQNPAEVKTLFLISL